MPRIRADQLYAILAHLEMLLDWDEEEERDEDRITITSDLKEAESALQHLVSTFRSGRVVREGSVVIAGNPNVGKSSLSMRCQVAPPLSAIFPAQHATR